MGTESILAALLLLAAPARPVDVESLRPLPTREARPEPTRVAARHMAPPAWDDPEFGVWMRERHEAGAGVIACGVSPVIHGARTAGTMYLDFAARLVWVDLGGTEPPFQFVRYAMPGRIETARGARAWRITTAMSVDFWIEVTPSSRRGVRVVTGGSSEIEHPGEAPCDAPLPLPSAP